MPCQSPAELEHGKWLTLPEAVAYICAADRCERDDARQKLVAPVIDSAVFV